MTKDTCVSSIEATDEILLNNINLINHLINDSRSTITTRKKYCSQKQCVMLSFHHVQPGEFCILLGNIGTCSTTSSCVLPLKKQEYPNIGKMMITRSKSPILENYMYFCTYIFYVLLDFVNHAVK